MPSQYFYTDPQIKCGEKHFDELEEETENLTPLYIGTPLSVKIDSLLYRRKKYPLNQNVQGDNLQQAFFSQ